MSKRRTRIVACSLLAASTVMFLPAESRACEWLDRLMPWNWCRNDSAVAATTYCPPCTPVAQAVATPAACTTCSYIPQTCYRTAYANVPVTSCRPVISCDPCTGCPCTAYQPVTSYVRQAQLVPYTIYQPVYSAAPSAPCTSCAPAVTTAAPASSSCCGSPPPYYSPSPSTAPASPIPATPTPTLGSGSVAPSTAPAAPSSPGTRSYRVPETTNPTERLKPVPTEETTPKSSTPPSLTPPIRSTGNTAMRATRQAAYVTPVSSPRVSDSGWRASRD